MKLNKNDPRLTAYVLNELDANEKIIIEKALNEDPELRAEVQNLQKGVGQFKTHFSSRETLRLSDEQREKIFSAAEAVKKSSWSWLTIGGGLVAASLALMIFKNIPDPRKFDEPAAVVSQIPVTAPESQLAKKPIADESAANKEARGAPAEPILAAAAPVSDTELTGPSTEPPAPAETFAENKAEQAETEAAPAPEVPKMKSAEMADDFSDKKQDVAAPAAELRQAAPAKPIALSANAIAKDSSAYKGMIGSSGGGSASLERAKSAPAARKEIQPKDEAPEDYKVSIKFATSAKPSKIKLSATQEKTLIQHIEDCVSNRYIEPSLKKTDFKIEWQSNKQQEAFNVKLLTGNSLNPLLKNCLKLSVKNQKWPLSQIGTKPFKYILNVQIVSK